MISSEKVHEFISLLILMYTVILILHSFIIFVGVLLP